MIARLWRVVVLALSLAFASLAVEANAQTYPDQGAAYKACMEYITNYVNGRSGVRNPSCPSKVQGTNTVYEGRNEYVDGVGNWGNYIKHGTFIYITANSCKSRVDGQAGMINGTMYSGGVCDNGCKVQPNLDPGVNFSLRENGNPNAIPIRSGTWRASGDTCFAEAPPKPDAKDEYCHATSSGHTVCKSKDRTCVTSGSGFRTCASDTANQTGHTQTNTQRTEAASIGAPNTPANPPTNRPGENWKPSSGGGGVTNNNTNTTNNYNTYKNEGTPNGNEPIPGDGSGPGQGGSNGNGGKDGDGKGDSAADSGNCQSPPQCTGDTLKCLQLNYTWRVQCNTKGAEISGGDGCGDNDIPVCAGSTCKAETYASLLQQWRQRCAAQNMGQGMANRAANISNPDDAAALDGVWLKPGDVDTSLKLRTDMVNVGGGGPLFPAITLEGRTWQPAPEMYDALAGIRLLVIAACTVTAMFVVGRNV